MSKFSVQKLRKQGYKIRVIHARPYLMYDGETPTQPITKFDAEDMGLSANDALPTGGETIVELTAPNGETLRGIAECSQSQQFYRKLGVYIALGRALGEHPTEQDFFKELKAKKIVDRLLCNLHGRREVGASLDNVPQDVYESMEEQLIEVVKGQL